MKNEKKTLKQNQEPQKIQPVFPPKKSYDEK